MPSAFALLAFGALPVRVRTASQELIFALAITTAGAKEIVGLWGPAQDGWAARLEQLRCRGLTDVEIVQGDAMLRLAAGPAYPGASLQGCIPQLMRRSLLLAAQTHRKTIEASLRAILRADSAGGVAAALRAFAGTKHGTLYPDIVALWRAHASSVAALFELAPPLRRFVEAFDAQDSLKSKFARRATRLPMRFDSAQAAMQGMAAELMTMDAWHVAPHMWAGPQRHFAQRSSRLSAVTDISTFI